MRTGTKPAHVWHCSLSLRADEGQLSDEQWSQITTDFVRAMEFDDNQGTKAPCRWVAVRHGLSGDGNDHVHLAVSLVRDDGTKASTHKDFYRAQQAARALEVVHGLERLESSVAGEPGATRGFTPAEQRKAEERAAWVARTTIEKRDGAGAWDQLTPDERRAEVARRWRLNLPREVLARKVRGCATASADEAEFVRRLRKTGLLVRPRFAEGTQDVIAGYSVAERPASRAERPVWYGGNRLARDLGLTRLREHTGWPDDPVTGHRGGRRVERGLPEPADRGAGPRERGAGPGGDRPVRAAAGVGVAGTAADPAAGSRCLGTDGAGAVRGAGGLVGEYRSHARSPGPRLAHAGPIGADVPPAGAHAGTGAASVGRHRPAGLRWGEARPRSDRPGRDDARTDDAHRSDRGRGHRGPAEPAGRPAAHGRRDEPGPGPRTDRSRRSDPTAARSRRHPQRRR